MTYIEEIAGGLMGGILMLCWSLRQRAREREKQENVSQHPILDLTDSSHPKFKGTDLDDRDS
jgi:hypothetical protein